MNDAERQLLLVAMLRFLTGALAVFLPCWLVAMSYTYSWWGMLMLPGILLVSWSLLVLRDNLP